MTLYRSTTFDRGAQTGSVMAKRMSFFGRLLPIIRISSIRNKIACLVVFGAFLVGNGAPAAEIASDQRDDTSPWGVASGAEWLSAYRIFNPLLKEAGVRWFRSFYEWQTIQPKQGYWNFTLPDHLLANARANNMHVVGTLAYLAPWASADGGTRRFPIKDIQFWRDYVAGMVERYHTDIKYWEVWNEFNGSFAENGTPEIYAELVREASIAAKKIDPTAKIGMSVANFDVNFLDRAIKAGAANHFDYICVHPYEKLSALMSGGEPGFLAMTGLLRQMLASNHQPIDAPLWITEIGDAAPTAPNVAEDQAQADFLSKAYLLSIASGFQRIFWFEARGPSYGGQRDFGLIRANMTLRPSYDALKAMTTILGAAPTAAGRIDLGDESYGFLFDAQGQHVMSAWTTKKDGIDISFPGDVRVTDLRSDMHSLSAGVALHLTNRPLLILDIPDVLLQQAQFDKMQAHSEVVEHRQSAEVSLRLQATNTGYGIRQIAPETTISDSESRRTNISRADGEGHYVYFLIDPKLVPFGVKEMQITTTVRRLSRDRPAGFSINYESQKGYIDTSFSGIPEADGWHEISWKITDASFVGQWGWNFRVNAISSPNDFLIKEVRVKINP
jgi:polysaccharide biosynthesis protein PslG